MELLIIIYCVVTSIIFIVVASHGLKYYYLDDDFLGNVFTALAWPLVLLLIILFLFAKFGLHRIMQECRYKMLA